jgi:hypothetical protein
LPLAFSHYNQPAELVCQHWKKGFAKLAKSRFSYIGKNYIFANQFT